MRTESDTIVSIATPVSNSGIGIIRMSGDDTFSIIASVFHPFKKDVDVNNLEHQRIYYGTVREDGQIIDECIMLVMKGPNSYTREDVAEIDCHGGVHVIYRILDLLIKKGARPAEPGEFTKRAFLNGRIDISQAEAVMDLIESKNESARKNSIMLLQGKLSEEIKELRSEIVYQIAYIESALDDPDYYDLTGYPEELAQKNRSWMEKIRKMTESFRDGRLIREGISTCIVGKPNVGKSSFLNYLLGNERAIVSEIAGTTRDTLEETVTVEGITLNIIDTAGIRETADIVEKIGVDRARKETEKADLIFFVADQSVPLSEEDKDILEMIRKKKKIILMNKSDLDHRSLLDEKDIRPYILPGDPVIPISAKYGDGMEILMNEIKNIMFSGQIDVNSDIVITNERHKNALDQALNALSCLEKSIEDLMPEDFFTIDMTNAYEHLGLVIGESLGEDIIDEIFSRFCTGK